MKHSLNQQQDLRQQQRLTPLQVQFVRMLEMTGPEIETEVKRSLEDMPALEVAESSDNEPAETAESFNESPEQMQRADFSDDDDTPSYMLDARNYSRDDKHYEPVAVNDEESLAESLQTQLRELDLDDETRGAALYIIGNLDGNGYLRRSPRLIADDIAIATGIDIPQPKIEAAWHAVRSLDPAGIGASDLRDCLLLQLERRQQNPTVELATKIVGDCFDLFSKKHSRLIAERLGVSIDDVRSAVELISRLNPKPGNQHGESALERSGRLIVPEFLVEPEGDTLTVTLLNNVPELAISATFRDDTPLEDMSMSPRQKADALTFVRTRRDEASNFIKTLQMRQSTLFNVMTAIAEIQRDFFMTGDETLLKPMILKDVANRTGYNLSVISRATASKYVMTVAGIYPLKFFFNERPKEDDDVTFHQIAAAMRAIIDAEDTESPASDEAITAALRSKGFNIARRTVAKYRERLGIPVARLRRSL